MENQPQQIDLTVLNEMQLLRLKNSILEQQMRLITQMQELANGIASINEQLKKFEVTE